MSNCKRDALIECLRFSRRTRTRQFLLARDFGDGCRHDSLAARSERCARVTYTAVMKSTVAVLLVFTLFMSTLAQKKSSSNSKQTPAAGYWPLEKSQPIIDKTQTIRLAPDLSQLSAGERAAIAKLVEVGKIFQEIFEDQRHKQALSSDRDLGQLDKRNGS